MQGSSSQARSVAGELGQKILDLKSLIHRGLTSQVADDFLDINTPIKQLSDAAYMPLGMCEWPVPDP